MYDVLKFVHVLAVIVWLGGGIMLTLLAGRAHRSEVSTLAGVAKAAVAVGGVFGPLAGIALLTGIGMVLASGGGIGWASVWINIGFVGFLASSILGARFISPAYERLAEVAATGDASAIDAARAKLIPVTMADLTILTVVVAAMVFKWGATAG